jgi:hypothetical protein
VRENVDDGDRREREWRAKLPIPFRALSETRNATRWPCSSDRQHNSQHTGEKVLRTDMRERSTSAVRSSRSCPDDRVSHSVASLMNVKDAPSAGRPAPVASFSTCGPSFLISAGRARSLAEGRKKGKGTPTRMHNPCFCAAVRRRRMNIVISACPVEDGSTCAPRHRRRGQPMPGTWGGTGQGVGWARAWCIYLAKIRHSGVAPVAPSPCPALQCGMDVLVIPVCRRCRIRYRGLRWCVRLLRCRMSMQCSVV